MRVLDLFCGGGGASYGYSLVFPQAEITGVDIKPQKHYPFQFVQGDAIEYLEQHGHEYDFIHASPPCQGYSESTPAQYKGNHPLLIPTVREQLDALGKPYVIENVEGARWALNNPLMLCGSMFGLPILRHRLFELGGFEIYFTPPCCHNFKPILITGTTGNSKSPKAPGLNISLQKNVKQWICTG